MTKTTIPEGVLWWAAASIFVSAEDGAHMPQTFQNRWHSHRFQFPKVPDDAEVVVVEVPV